jgi:hypothetical protein
MGRLPAATQKNNSEVARPRGQSLSPLADLCERERMPFVLGHALAMKATRRQPTCMVTTAETSLSFPTHPDASG